MLVAICSSMMSSCASEGARPWDHESVRRARPTFELEVDDLKHITLMCSLVGGSMEIAIAKTGLTMQEERARRGVCQ
jgi:hypothetical protein